VSPPEGVKEIGVISDLDAGRNPFEEAIRQLVGSIHSGDLPTGARLPPERELSDELGISRSTLRSVIRALQQAQYIQTQRGRSGGSFVIWRPDASTSAPPRRSSEMKARLLDTLLFRSVLEPGAAGMAAELELSEEQVSTLRDRLAAVTTHDTDFRLADQELHSYIAELSGCRALSEAIANIQLILNESLLRIVPLMGPALEHSHQQHSQIVEAILSGDSARARQLMTDHVCATTELIKGFLQ